MALILLGASVHAQGVPVLTVAVVGESNLKAKFIESLRESASGERVQIDIKPRTDATLDYTVIIAQESSLGGAAAAVIAMDKAGDVAASVVRSGRMSGKGALNACAKELIKKLKVLR
ncbi:MAG TPA: hypothetical protein VHL34_24765 [Rhizomicrobium sp.]|nr:hypothetical protein [Rhizomicrobium sp.]